MSKHTPEPWHAGGYEVQCDKGTTICNMSGWKNQSVTQENARRIVACVNACEGMEDPVEVIKGLKEALARTTHQVITCGVAARHPDANLSRRECDYGGKWDSPQAESVRQLRKERDDLLTALDWSDSQIMEFISIAFRHAEIKGDFELSDVRDALNVISSKAKGGAA